ncbi:unnamed protein product [Cunninghamella blakesleeana]
MASQLDNYWEIRDRDRERERERDCDRDCPMMLMRDDRYMRGRDDRFPPYYRDDSTTSHHYQSNTMLPREPNKPSSASRLENNIERPSIISTKSKDDSMKPTTPTEMYSSRYNDWRDRDRDRDRRYRDDDRRRDYDRRNRDRDGYNMRYDNSSYAGSSSSGYPPPPFGGDSYRPGGRDREPVSPVTHSYYDRDGRDRFDDREFYRPISRGPSMDFDRYRNRPRPNSSSSSSWRNSSRERERDKDISGKPNYGSSSALSSSSILKDDIKSQNSRLDDVESNEQSSIPNVSVKSEPSYDQTIPLSSLSQSSRDDKINDAETKVDIKNEVVSKNKINHSSSEQFEAIDKTKKNLKIEILPRNTGSDSQMNVDSPLPTSASTQLSIQSSTSIVLPISTASLNPSIINTPNNDFQKSTNITSTPLQSTNINNSIISTESISETLENNTNDKDIKIEEGLKESTSSLSNDDNKQIMEIDANMDTDSIIKKEENEKSATSMDEDKENTNPILDNQEYIKSGMNQQQIVARIDEIENDISMYEEMLEHAVKREAEQQEKEKELQNQDVNMEAGSPIDVKDEDVDSDHEQEEAKQKALQAISDSSQPMTDIQNLPFNESPVMRRRPQILINQIMTQNDEIDEALSKMIITKNKEIAKENSKLLDGWQGKLDDGLDWSDEEKWYAPLYKNIQDYPCYYQNDKDFKKMKKPMAQYLATNAKLLKQKERRLKREFKEIYNQWKNKNLALDRMRDQERRGSDRYSNINNNSNSNMGNTRSSSRRGRGASSSVGIDEEPEEYVDGIIFTGNHDALRFNTDGGGRNGGKSTWTSDAARSEAELLEIIQSLESAEMRNPELRAAKTTATIPAMILDVKERARTYNDRSGLIEDPLTYYHTGSETEDVWTQQEMTAFMESYMQYPKQFDKISASVKTKTAPQCVLFYYRKKTKIDFKALMRKGRRGKNKKRDRLAAAIRRATSDTSSTTRKGKSKGSALMADIGQAQVSRKAKEKDSEGKSKELRELEEANAYWESVAERRKSKRPTSNFNPTSSSSLTTSSTNASSATVGTSTSTTTTNKSINNVDDNESLLMTRRKVNRRKGRSPRSSVSSVPDPSLIFPEDEEDEVETAPSTPALSLSTDISPPTSTPAIATVPTTAVSSSVTASVTANDINISTSSAKQRQISSNGTLVRDGTPDTISSSTSLSGLATAKWNDQDKQAAVEAFKQYGRDFVKVSAKVGTKTDEQCRNFYFNHKRKYGPNAFNESGKESLSDIMSSSSSTPTTSNINTYNDASLSPPPSSNKITSISNIISSSSTSPKSLVASEIGRTDLKAEEEDAAAALVGMFQMGANRDAVRESTPTSNPSSSPTVSELQPLQPKNRRRIRTTSGKLDQTGINDDWPVSDDASIGRYTTGKKTAAELKKGSNSSYWSVSERGEFSQYLELYGKDWTKLANAMKTKTAIQVRNFYQNNEEKMQLNKIVQRFEANQSNIIPSSSPSQYNHKNVEQKQPISSIGGPSFDSRIHPSPSSSSPTVLRPNIPPQPIQSSSSRPISQPSTRSPFYRPHPSSPSTTSPYSSYPAPVDHHSPSSSSSIPPPQPSVFSPTDRTGYFSSSARSTQSPIAAHPSTSNYYSNSPPPSLPPSHHPPPPSSYNLPQHPPPSHNRPFPPSGPGRDILNPTSSSKSNVTRVSDLLNSNEDSEESNNSNTWQSWFGA